MAAADMFCCPRMHRSCHRLCEVGFGCRFHGLSSNRLAVPTFDDITLPLPLTSVVPSPRAMMNPQTNVLPVRMRSNLAGMSGCHTGRAAGRFLALLWLVILTALMGCGKKAPAPTTQSQPPVQSQNPPAVGAGQSAAPPVGQQTSALMQPDGQPDLPELNRTLLRWILANRRRPASFEDFSATAGVVIPPPPAGKKYTIRKDMHIVLVDR